MFKKIASVGFGELPISEGKLNRLGKLTYMILYFQINTAMCVFNITIKCIILPWFLHEIQFTVYFSFDLPAYSASLLNF